MVEVWDANQVTGRLCTGLYVKEHSRQYMGGPRIRHPRRWGMASVRIGPLETARAALGEHLVRTGLPLGED